MTHQERLSARVGWNAVYYFCISVYFRLSESGGERGHKPNGLVHSIKRRLVWLGRRPKYNILRSAAGGFSGAIWEAVKVRFYVCLLVFSCLSRPDSWDGRKCLRSGMCQRPHFFQKTGSDDSVRTCVEKKHWGVGYTDAVWGHAYIVTPYKHTRTKTNARKCSVMFRGVKIMFALPI